MLKKILLAVLLVLIVITPVLAQDPIYLPLTVKGSGGGPMLPAELYITDGTTSISFIKPEGVSGYHLVSWRPAVADYKGGGTWQDSPLADGRRLVDKRFMNVIETFRLTAQGENPDALIEELQEMRRLLEKAADYWATDWQNEPVWIVARAHDETERRYALIHRGRIPEDDNPYAQPFMHHNGCPVMNNLTLVVERGPWLGFEPGEGTCVKTSGLAERWEYEEWLVSTNQPVGIVRALYETSCGNMLAGETNEVWRTADGSIWNASVLNPTMTVYAFAETPSYIYAVGNTGVWRSSDCGVNWVQRSAVQGTTTGYSIIVADDGSLYMCAGNLVPPAPGISRSTDGGVTWTTVFDLTGNVHSSIYQASDGFFYAGVASLIYRSENGIHWSAVYDTDLIGGDFYATFKEYDGFIYAVGYLAPGAVYRTGNGTDWERIAQFAPGVYDLIKIDDSFYIILSNGEIYIAGDDLANWTLVTDIGDSGRSLIEYSGNNRIYAGENGDVWVSGVVAGPIGRTATCEDEVYLANKVNVAQITHVKVYDASGPTYTDRFPVTVFPFDLLPDPFVAGDMVYFGIDTSVFQAGPFSSLVFDIYDSLQVTGANTIRWEYSQGGGAWAVLNVTDNTAALFPFDRSGVYSVHWVPPNDWAADTVDLITALWVRVNVVALGAFVQAPTQQNRDVYTIDWPYASIDEAQVLGDIPALMQFRFHNRSDEDGYETSDELDLLDNRVIVGLRTLNRGDSFTAYLNCADEQNPPGLFASVTAPTTSFINEIRTPSGRAAEHLTQGLGLTRYTTEVTFTFSPTITRDYYGIYHAYVRAQLHESGVYTSGDQDDVRVRLQTQSGSGGVTHTTKYQEFTGVDAWGVTEEEVYKDWQLLDFGQIRLPVTQRLRADELPDQMSVSIQVASAAGTLLLVDFYDLVLIPVDEWAGDFVDHALETDSCVENGYMLDVDSVTYPKYDIRAQVRTFGGELLRADWQSIVPGPAILQANADQKLWFLTARAVYMGIDTVGAAATTLTDINADFTKGGVKPGMIAYNLTTGNSARITAVGTTTCTTEAIVGSWNANDEYMIICPNWRSEPWVVHSIRVFNNPRYLSMRGAR